MLSLIGFFYAILYRLDAYSCDKLNRCCEQSVDLGDTVINVLEKFQGTMKFEKVPPPRWDTLGFWGETVERWRQEGLPADMSPQEYFGQEGMHRLPVHSGFVDSPFYPAFDYEVISEDEETVVFRDSSGVIKRDRKSGGSMSQFLEFPVKRRADWENLKCRLNPDSPERYPDWDDMRRTFYDNRQAPVILTICGAYGLPRNLFGEEHLAYAYYDDPELMHDIQSHWLDFYKRMFSIILAQVPLDFVYIWEDMAFKNGPLISPRLFEEFMLPYYTELIRHIKSLGLEWVMVDSDGDNRPIMDQFVQSGVNFFMPFEIASNMDPLELREKYGKSLVFWGGIDKRELAKDLDAVEREVMKKVPKLIEYGGFIPAVDHLVPPDVPFANYARFIELIRKICGG